MQQHQTIIFGCQDEGAMNTVEPSKVYRLFYPSVPAIVACNDGGKTYAMPVVSIISLSNEPSLVGVSSSPSHATHGAVLRAGRFSVSWLSSRFVRAVETLGTAPSTSDDKLKLAGLKHGKGRLLDVPVIEGSSAVLECSLAGRQPFGDHELLVGRVEEARAASDFGDYWRFRGYRPILYAGSPGRFRTYRR
jgi:flavin reductase (DIM6/NTAB) family NADH-FMN oxidoreductase RutF